MRKTGIMRMWLGGILFMVVILAVAYMFAFANLRVEFQSYPLIGKVVFIIGCIVAFAIPICEFLEGIFELSESKKEIR